MAIGFVLITTKPGFEVKFKILGRYRVVTDRWMLFGGTLSHVFKQTIIDLTRCIVEEIRILGRIDEPKRSLERFG